jgi:activating signal cointegrator complex subunit 1
MGKKKPPKSDYNDFLDGEKLTDNIEIRTTLQGPSTRATILPRPLAKSSYRPGRNKKKGGPKKPPLTHFLCLSLVTEASRQHLQARLATFKEELAKDGPVPTKAVRPVGTLHMTLGVMSLNPQELEGAVQHLANLNLHNLLRDITHRRIAEKAAEDGTIAENLNAAAMPDTDALTVNLESLVPMQAPHKTSILYAEPRDGTQRLVPFAEELREQFTKKGFMVEDDRPLRLHATILNTVYAKPKKGKGRLLKQAGTEEKQQQPHQEEQEDDNASVASTMEGDLTALPDPSTVEPPDRNEGHGPDGKSWMRFDARSLIEKYKDFVWAEDVRIDRVLICKMGAKKILSEDGEVLDEAYEVVASRGILCRGDR